MKWLLFLSILHIIICPYTKVEESFNMQAMHDLEFWVLGQLNFYSFDHFTFPGVVPRSFLGATAVATMATPIIKASEFLFPIENRGIIALLASRIILAMIVLHCLRRLRNSLSEKFGEETGKWFQWICCSQFHLVFYLGRPLPNTYALGLCALGLAEWIRGEWARALSWMAFCTIIFRCDTIILTGIVALLVLFRGEAGFFPIAINGIATGIVSLCVTIGFDSIFWNKLLWPEGVVLFFNTVMNKSSEWGIMPFHWYFTSALPKALLVTLPLALLCWLLPQRPHSEKWLDTQPLVYFLIPSLGYTIVYSILPHKEVRFLFQVFPFFSAAAALTMSKLQLRAFPKTGKGKTTTRNLFSRLLLLGACAGLVLSTVIASVFVALSAQNYPGGEALTVLQNYHLEHYGRDTPVNAHYCTYAAMSGITRFLEEKTSGTIDFSKREDEAFVSGLCESGDFTYLIVEDGKYDTTCESSYRIVAEIYGQPKLSPKVKNVHAWKTVLSSSLRNPKQAPIILRDHLVSKSRVLLVLERKTPGK